MSWPAWHTSAPPIPSLVAAPAIQSAVLPGTVNPAPALVNPAANIAAAAGIQYTPEQWAQMQQQNWQQWAQWQQQYQQWHQQYGAEYQKSLNALSMTGTNTSIPPPPPNENKPPPPPPPDHNAPIAATGFTVQQQYTTAPPTSYQHENWQNAKRPFPHTNDFESNKRQMIEQWNSKMTPSAKTQPTVPVPQKNLNLEELTEAERKFDKEFAAWEAQFNKWKDQNANHPDKTQYLKYEKKWESWRNSLLDRREQMRKKRVALQTTLSANNMAASIQPNFNQPPPKPTINTDVFSKPPPTQNNEPLAFKAAPPPISAAYSESNTENSDGSGFLKSSSPATGGIPGLDLVKEGPGQDTVIVEPEEKPVSTEPKGPDLEAISKGINTILGDPKLLNMLSMVSQSSNFTGDVKSGSIPSLLSLPLQRPGFEKSNQSFEDYAEPLSTGPSSETVNNFDDQTRMSFTNASTEQEVNYTNTRPPSTFRQFSETTNKPMFNTNQNFDRTNNFENGGHQSYNRPPYQGYNNNKNSYEEENNQWNEEEEYEQYHSIFNEEQIADPPTNVEEAKDEPLFVPQVVVDYEHKSLKEPEPEICLEVIRMFDYRHKPVNRIPYPQRPVWLSSSLRNIKQFDPLGTGRFGKFENPNMRYPIERSDYGRRYDDKASEEKYGYVRERYVENKPERPRPDFIRGRAREKYEYGGPKKPNEYPKHQPKDTKPQDLMGKLELEDLSDDEWTDEKPYSSKGFEKPRPVVLHATSSNSSLTLENLIYPPGRFSRPPKIVVILRGPPGSGKTFLAKLIKDREVENGGSAPRILSLDDYFMVEHEKEVFEDGKTMKIKEMVYEYEPEMEESYRQSLIKSFKKTITDGYFSFVVVDNVNQKVKNFGEMWSFAKQNGFQVYICQLDLDPELCSGRNIHQRNESYIEDCIAGWEPTPSHHPLIDATSFLQNSGPITEVEMEEVQESQEQMEEAGEGQIRSKWDTFDCSLNNLARLDGVSKPLRPSRTMEEYLQLENEWEEPGEPLKPGKKRVRWADLEEQKQQKKIKALGFIVGHTNWDRVTDETNGGSALVQTKYIESRYNKQ